VAVVAALAVDAAIRRITDVAARAGRNITLSTLPAFTDPAAPLHPR